MIAKKWLRKRTGTETYAIASLGATATSSTRSGKSCNCYNVHIHFVQANKHFHLTLSIIFQHILPIKMASTLSFSQHDYCLLFRLVDVQATRETTISCTIPYD